MRIARSTLLADVLRPGLVLVFNGTKHPIVLPTFDERTLPMRRELGALRNEMDKLQELKNVADTAAEKVRTVTSAAHCLDKTCGVNWGRTCFFSYGGSFAHSTRRG